MQYHSHVHLVIFGGHLILECLLLVFVIEVRYALLKGNVLCLLSRFQRDSGWCELSSNIPAHVNGQVMLHGVYRYHTLRARRDTVENLGGTAKRILRPIDEGSFLYTIWEELKC